MIWDYKIIVIMKKDTIVKMLLVFVTVLFVLWIILLLYSENRSSSVSLMKRTQPLTEELKPLTSMSILDTVTNISVEQGDTLTVTYKIVNTGVDSLFISNINPDCGCTDYKISSKSSGTSDTLSLNVLVDTKGKFGDNLIHIVLEANTPEKMYMVRLPFYVRSGQIPTDSLETKRNFRFHRMRVGETKIIYSKIKNNYHKDILVELMTSCDCIDVEPRSIYVKSGKQCEYVIKARPATKGDYSEYVILCVAGTKHRIRVDVTGTVD